MKKNYSLPADFAHQWLAALRSGKYKQVQNSLYNGKNEGFCCLGVAEYILGTPKELLEDFTIPDLLANPRCPHVLFCNVEQEFSLGNEVASFNDNGFTFEEIADWVEENVTFTPSTPEPCTIS